MSDQAGKPRGPPGWLAHAIPVQCTCQGAPKLDWGLGGWAPAGRSIVGFTCAWIPRSPASSHRHLTPAKAPGSEGCAWNPRLGVRCAPPPCRGEPPAPRRPRLMVAMTQGGQYEGVTDSTKDHVCVAVRFRPLRCARSWAASEGGRWSGPPAHQGPCTCGRRASSNRRPRGGACRVLRCVIGSLRAAHAHRPRIAAPVLSQRQGAAARRPRGVGPAGQQQRGHPGGCRDARQVRVRLRIRRRCARRN